MAEIPMPRLSDTMEEGTLLRWLKQDGDHVSRGDELVEIETDKANMTYESDTEGILEIVAKEGETLAVGVLIARIGEPSGAEASTGGAGEASGATLSAGGAGLSATRDLHARQDQEDPLPDIQETRAEGDRVKASPLARRIAQERGIDLHDLSGSGPGGRIVKSDLEPSQEAEPSVDGPPHLEETSGPPIAVDSLAERVARAKGQTTVVELNRTQQTIARRMAESKATIPHFALEVEVDMHECVNLRQQLKRLSPIEAPTYNDMVVKAASLALREHPHANASYKDGHLELHSRINLGVAVAVQASSDSEGGALLVPTVFDADTKSLGEIASETSTLAERVRAGTITPPELGGGTFTVSNLGMYGVQRFTAIVNPPQAGILSVGSLGPRAVVRDGELLVRETMALTLACDHRILYGSDAAQFLARVRELLESPASLTL